VPDNPQAVLSLALLAAAAIVAVVVLLLLWQAERRRSQARIEQLLQDRDKSVADARKESLERSRATLKGRIAEQMAPLLPGFSYLPSDARFLGDPIDYVVFNGATGAREKGGAPESLGTPAALEASPALEVVLLEVKQGGSALSTLQRAIAAAVEAGRVRFEVCRVADDGTAATQSWPPARSLPAARTPRNERP
jgi:predicted Holliday junction resolvase-like endonuclease